MATLTFSPRLKRLMAARVGQPAPVEARERPTRPVRVGPDNAEPEADSRPFWDFETEEDARKEDRARVKGLKLARPREGRTTWTNLGPRLRLLKQMPHPTAFPERQAGDFDRFLHRLDGEAKGVPSNSLGSSVTMRTIRETVFGAMLTAFEDYPDGALETFTVINQNWTVSPADLDKTSAEKLKGRFRADLNKVGITRMQGPFIAFLHCEFEPASGLYIPHFHGTTTREKAEVLKGLKAKEGSKKFLGYVPTATGGAPVVCKPVRDRHRQFSYLLKSYWPARTIRWIDGAPKRDRKHHRIPEPFASQVLLWLDRQRLRDLTIMNDCWSMRNGGTEAMKQLYLSVFGAW